jgi:hypothetical protein
MKKLSILLLAIGFAFSVNTATAASCGKNCKCKEKCEGKECKDCKKMEATPHKCNAQCHKNGAGHVPSHGEKGHKCTDECKK